MLHWLRTISAGAIDFLIIFSLEDMRVIRRACAANFDALQSEIIVVIFWPALAKWVSWHDDFCTYIQIASSAVFLFRKFPFDSYVKLSPAMTLDYGRRGQPPPAMFFYHTHAVRHRSQSHKKCKPREQLKHHQQSKIHKQNTRRRRRNWNWKEQTRRTKAIWIVYCERHSREIFVHSNFQTYVYVVVFFAVAGDSSCCRKRVTPQ